MYTPKGLLRLKELRKLNFEKNNFQNNRLYRLFYCKDLFIAAYEKLKSNKGSLTASSDTATMDTMSIQRIEKLIELLRSEKWRPRLARRIFISKPNGNKRPLEIQGPEEKLVQEVMRMILEAIYDSNFHNCSHGFRAHKSCLTAINEIRQNFDGVSFIIEGDFEKCFDSFNHEILISIIRRRITDQKFINLLYKLLKAGYLQINSPTQTSTVLPKLGTPQGSVISPMLANIYLHDLDSYVKHLIAKYWIDQNPLKNPANNVNLTGIKRIKTKLSIESDPAIRSSLLKELTKFQIAQTLIPYNRRSVKIYYVRYADDWIIGVNGPIKIAKEIKSLIAKFTQTSLALELNEEKTKITDIKNSGPVLFLGYHIQLQKRGSIIKKYSSIDHHKFYKGSTGHKIKLLLPCEKLVISLFNKGYCDVNGFPLAYKKWSVFDDHLIVRLFNTVRIGLINYYCLIDNSNLFFRLDYILRYSLAKTLAHKHKSSTKKIFTKHGRNLTIKYIDPKGTTIETSMPKFKSYRPFLKMAPKQDPFNVIAGRLTRSRLDKSCTICGSQKSIEMHHIKHIRKIGAKINERTFTAYMGLINSKQLPVCAECHRRIHQGKYNGKALINLTQELKLMKSINDQHS